MDKTTLKTYMIAFIFNGPLVVDGSVSRLAFVHKHPTTRLNIARHSSVPNNCKCLSLRYFTVRATHFLPTLNYRLLYFGPLNSDPM